MSRLSRFEIEKTTDIAECGVSGMRYKSPTPTPTGHSRQPVGKSLQNGALLRVSECELFELTDLT